MSNDARAEPRRGGDNRFPIGTLLRALLPALGATAIVVLIFARSSPSKPKVRADGLALVTLSQKDSAFQPIPPARGGASGELLYTPKGRALHLMLHAARLPVGVRVELELQVDTVVYTVATYTPDAHGQLVVDTTLSRFQEGECVGTNFDAPRSVAGKHSIKFWIKRDGSPSSGTMPGIPPSAPGAQLGCHGNGDGNYAYLLLENEVATFIGADSSENGSR